jgi:hypothetical protein
MLDNIMDDLTHHGVKGMKWGKRKDTNQAGSESKRKRKPKKLSKAESMAKDLQDAKKMSPRELQDKVNKLRLEHEYVRLNSTKYNDTKTKIDNAVSTMGKISAATGTALVIYKNIDKIIKIGSKLAGAA